MRSLADLQRPPGSTTPAGPAGLPMDVDRVRTFDTPEFAGMTFLEVTSKTALNRVRGMMFDWSINPYRGCSHACSYCLSGETSVLLGDGRTKMLADLRVGEVVYGTRREGSHRRYVLTEVIDHWETLRRAYRVHLEDGTVLTASADHRLLTNRGWKHVAGEGRGPGCRPHLTTNDRLIGTGGFAGPPKQGDEYRRGYLCGMIRGDGSFHPGGTPMRLALVDSEGLDRTAAFLAEYGLPSRSFPCQKETPTRKPVHAIVCNGRRNVGRIRELISWPILPSEQWTRGFLAGTFDAAGGYSRGILRISNSDPVILDALERGLRRIDVPHVLEPPAPNGCRTVRVRGGLKSHLRFFHATDPAIARKRSIEGVALNSDAPLRVVAIEPMRYWIPMYDITTGTGDFIADGVVSHNCFARPTHEYLNLSPLEDFEKTIVVKTNVVEVLKRELARPSWRGEHVAMGTNTDNYQRAEGRYQLMPGIIRALGESYTPFSILTKGTLITRDIPLLLEAAENVDVTATFTIGMLDDALWRSAEPGTPSPRARLDAVRALNEAGIPTGVMLAPIMPGLNDDEEQLAALIDAIAQTGATHISPIVLHLRPKVRELFWPWLEREHPELVPRYRELYAKGSRALREYRGGIEGFVEARRKEAWKRYGPPRPAGGLRGRPARRARPEAEPPPEQLSLL